MPILRLPKPSIRGDYWLHGPPPEGIGGPAIFKSGLPSRKGQYFASRGNAGGVVFERAEIKYYATAIDALSELNVLLEKGG